MGTRLYIHLIMASTFPPTTLKRIQKDLKSLSKEPVINCGAAPREDDLTFWDAVIEIEMTEKVTNKTKQVRPKTINIPMHFNIQFPSNYPVSAPSIGFSYEFKYDLGASYQKTEGPLKGKKVLCLDLLGNFDKIHTEWKNEIGSGWTSAYSVSSILVNLQSILSGLDESYKRDHVAREKLIKSALGFQLKFPDSIPKIARQKDIDVAVLNKKLPTELVKLSEKLGIHEDAEKLRELSKYFEKLGGNNGVDGPFKDETVEIDENIKCYVTGSNYTEDVLGYGISAVVQGRNNIALSSPAELLSLTAFQNGHRQSAVKTTFKFFIPAFINPKHGPENAGWQKCLQSSIAEIGDKVYNIQNNLAKSAYQIFPRLINTMVLEMMKSPVVADESCFEWDENTQFDVNWKNYKKFEKEQQKQLGENQRLFKAPSIAFFEAICSFWRTYYWLNENVLSKTLLPNAVLLADKFTKYDYARQKNACPDVGNMLANYTVVQKYVKFTNQEFIDALLDECFIRCVFWWKKNKVPCHVEKVFNATKTSRDLTLFQIYFLRFIVGEDVEKTKEIMDRSNGKAPELLMNFQKQWKMVEASCETWNDFFVKTGCSDAFAEKVKSDCQAWVRGCQDKAIKRGKAYYPVIKKNFKRTDVVDDGYDDKFDHYE